MSHPDAKWLVEYLKPLIGATIEDVGAAGDGDDWSGGWPLLIVRLPGEQETRTLEIGADEEGNGPGFVFGLDYPE